MSQILGLQGSQNWALDHHVKLTELKRVAKCVFHLRTSHSEDSKVGTERNAEGSKVESERRVSKLRNTSAVAVQPELWLSRA